MTIEYTWRVENATTLLSHQGLDNVVETVHWRLIGTDSVTGTSASEYGSVSLDLDAIDPNSFMTKAQLEADSSILIGWATSLVPFSAAR